jgi:hypothetical protein
LVSAGLLAFITAYFTVIGSHAASPAPQSPAGAPIIATVGEIDEDGGNMVPPNPVMLNANQLTKLSVSAAAPNSSYANWFAIHKGAFAGPAVIQLVVQGNRSGIVQIVNVSPAESCSRPLHGTLFYAPGQGSSASLGLYLNLNDPQTPASYTEGSSTVRHPDYFGNYTISLQHGEVFTFEITAAVTHSSCQFTLVLTGISDGKTFTQSVNDHGYPFRVTSLLTKPFSADSIPDFIDYQDLYLAGPAAGYKQDSNGTALWIRGNPKTYRGQLS